MIQELLRKGLEAFARYLYAQTGEDVTLDDVRFVWQVKCLQNYKYIITAPKVPGYIAELTYNGDKEELYVDCYCKMRNEVLTEKEDTAYD